MRNWKMTAVRVVPVVVALGSLTVLAPGSPGSFAGTASGSPGGGHASRGPRYYVSLGDSYAIGYQPSAVAGGPPHASPGYTAVVARATHFELENFGCAGATTTSVLASPGCLAPVVAVAGRVPYPSRTQAVAAERFLRRHRGHVGLVTISIGGNDITGCAKSAEPVTCLTSAVATVRRNVATLARGLRAAAGARVPIVGLTYPDVLLGLWVYPPGHPDSSLARLSVTAFKSLFNPALRAAYSSAGATLVDITGDTGAYTPLDRTTTLAPYGTVPQAVAEVCRLTWFCAQGNIHARSTGYDLIGRAVVAAYRAALSH